MREWWINVCPDKELFDSEYPREVVLRGFCLNDGVGMLEISFPPLKRKMQDWIGLKPNLALFGEQLVVVD